MTFNHWILSTLAIFWIAEYGDSVPIKPIDQFPEDPWPPEFPEDPLPPEFPEDPLPPVFPEDPWPPVFPEDPWPPEVPEYPWPPEFSEDPWPPVFPEDADEPACNMYCKEGYVPRAFKSCNEKALDAGTEEIAEFPIDKPYNPCTYDCKCVRIYEPDPWEDPDYYEKE